MSGPTLTPARSLWGKSQALRGILYREEAGILHINNISNRSFVLLNIFYPFLPTSKALHCIAVVKRDSKPDLINV